MITFAGKMTKALLYFFAATVLNFSLMRFAYGQPVAISLYYSAAFGLALSAAYFLDTEKIARKVKLLSSFSIMVILAASGLMFYDLQTAVPALIIYSAVFAGYYVAASFRESKSLRR